MSSCVVIASAASRKSIAIARSIKSVLRLKVVGVFHTTHPHAFSRWFDQKYLLDVCRDCERWASVVAGVAEKHGCSTTVAVDYIDFETFTKFRELFRERGVMVAGPEYENVITASNRVAIVEKLRGVAQFPPQICVRGAEDVREIHRLSPPLVVKGLGDASHPSFHLGFESTVEEALARAPCIVQEYVEGVARGYYAVSFNGAPLLEFTHQRIIEYSPIGGASLLARGPVTDPALFLLGRRIVEALRWSGPIMVETRYVDEYGQYYVLEVNPKFWGSIDLPTSLGYHFPAVLVAGYIYGAEYAKRLARKLITRSGGFAWILDGLRYTAKIPRVWLRIATSSPLYRYDSDVELSDLPRNTFQLIRAAKRIERERSDWMKYLEKSRAQLSVWMKRFLDVMKSRSKALILDLDGTLVEIPLKWSTVRMQLRAKGLLMPWEGVNRGLTRLWNSNRKSFYNLSKAVEEYEEKCVTKVKKLVHREHLEPLKQYFRICIATKQSHSVAVEILKNTNLHNLTDMVIGRDSGFGPVKVDMYKACIEKLGVEKAIVVDDSIAYLVEAYRKGLAPLCASRDTYTTARSYRLGIPSGPARDLMEIIIEYANDCFCNP